MKPYIWLDDKIVSIRNKDIPFCDEGFLYGQGLFETMRCYPPSSRLPELWRGGLRRDSAHTVKPAGLHNGRVFLLERHIERLIKSCPIMNLGYPDEALLKTAVLETVKRNKLDSGYVRLNVWKKKNGTGIFVFAKEVDFYKDNDYQKGFSAVIIKDIRQNETSPLSRVKSSNHYFYILVSEKAKALGYDEGIILNSKGYVCEGSRSNIFIVKDGIIFTPSINCGCLPGIARQAAIEIAKKMKLNLKESQLKPKDLFKSEEAFLTNSLIEIMPLTKVDDKLIGSGKIGKMTRMILDSYRALIKNSNNY